MVGIDEWVPAFLAVVIRRNFLEDDESRSMIESKMQVEEGWREISVFKAHFSTHVRKLKDFSITQNHKFWKIKRTTKVTSSLTTTCSSNYASKLQQNRNQRNAIRVHSPLIPFFINNEPPSV